MSLSDKKKNFLIISPEVWGQNLLSKHHFAIELANRGHNVFFLNPPGTERALKSGPMHKNIHQIEHKTVRGTRILNSNLRRFVQKLEIWLIIRKMKKKPDIVWSFDPYRLQWLKDFGTKVTIYHSVDNHFTQSENIIASEASIVLANTTLIFDKLNNPNKHLIGHGLANHFIEANITSAELPGKNKTSVGYVGNLINPLVDFDIISSIISSYPDIDFYFIGPKTKNNLASNLGYKDIDLVLEAYSNAYYLGQMDSHELPSYLHSFNILWTVYKKDKSGHQLNPHKLLEYLSSGNIVIATLTSEVLPEAHELIERIEKSSDLSNVFDKVIANLSSLSSSPKVKERKMIAAAHTYDKKVDRILEIIKEREDE